MKHTIEIEDTLQENVDSAIAETKNLLLEYIKDNDEIDNIVNDELSIYTNNKNNKDTWYLYKDELEEAYNNAGFGENPYENNGMTAIYCYIYEKVTTWFNNNIDELYNDNINK